MYVHPYLSRARKKLNCSTSGLMHFLGKFQASVFSHCNLLLSYTQYCFPRTMLNTWNCQYLHLTKIFQCFIAKSYYLDILLKVFFFFCILGPCKVSGIKWVQVAIFWGDRYFWGSLRARNLTEPSKIRIINTVITSSGLDTPLPLPCQIRREKGHTPEWCTLFQLYLSGIGKRPVPKTVLELFPYNLTVLEIYKLTKKALVVGGSGVRFPVSSYLRRWERKHETTHILFASLGRFEIVCGPTYRDHQAS